MKIGISGYVGNKLTGIGRVLQSSLIEIAHQNPDNEYILFVNKDFIEFINYDWPNNIVVVNNMPTKNSAIKNILWHQINFQISLRKYKCNIALIPNFSLLLWKQIPTVVIIHDLIEFNVPNKFSRIRMIYRRIIVPRMAKKSDYIITVSESSKKDIIKFCDVKTDKISVIPNGVNHLLFTRHSADSINRVLSKNSLKYKEYLLFVGTIDFPGKNIKTLLEVYFNLKKKYNISQNLVIVGKKGFNARVIYDFVENSEFKNNVLFTGFFDDNELPLLYAGAKILINLSLYEGFGLPVIEAMACGCPVVVPNTSCFPEIVKDIDVSVNPLDLIAIENKIYSLLTDSFFYNEVKDKCYLRSQNYSWSLSAQIYSEVFNKVLNN